MSQLRIVAYITHIWMRPEKKNVLEFIFRGIGKCEINKNRTTHITHYTQNLYTQGGTCKQTRYIGNNGTQIFQVQHLDTNTARATLTHEHCTCNINTRT